MSNLTICNRCTLLRIRRGLQPDEKLSLRSNPNGGIDVLVHPKSYKMPRKPTRDTRKHFFRAWFMALTEECVC